MKALAGCRLASAGRPASLVEGCSWSSEEDWVSSVCTVAQVWQEVRSSVVQVPGAARNSDWACRFVLSAEEVCTRASWAEPGRESFNFALKDQDEVQVRVNSQ